MYGNEQLGNIAGRSSLLLANAHLVPWYKSRCLNCCLVYVPILHRIDLRLQHHVVVYENSFNYSGNRYGGLHQSASRGIGSRRTRSRRVQTLHCEEGIITREGTFQHGISQVATAVHGICSLWASRIKQNPGVMNRLIRIFLGRNRPLIGPAPLSGTLSLLYVILPDPCNPATTLG